MRPGLQTSEPSTPVVIEQVTVHDRNKHRISGVADSLTGEEPLQLASESQRVSDPLLLYCAEALSILEVVIPTVAKILSMSES